MAEHLLPKLRQPASVTTLFRFRTVVRPMVTLLHLATFWGWENIVVMLVSVWYCAANSIDGYGNNPLHYSAYNGHFEVVKYLISILKPNAVMEQNIYGRTPLHLSSTNGHLKITQYLVEVANCNPSSVDKAGRTPLHFSCSKSHVNIAKYFIDDLKCNPLLRARMVGHHFILLVVKGILTSLSTSSVRYTAILQLRTMTIGRRFTLLVEISMLISYNTCCQLGK